MTVLQTAPLHDPAAGSMLLPVLSVHRTCQPVLFTALHRRNAHAENILHASHPLHPLWAELQRIHSVQNHNAVHIIYDVSQVAYAHLGRRPKQGSYASRQNAVSWGCRCQARLLTRKPLTGPSLQHSLSES